MFEHIQVSLFSQLEWQSLTHICSMRHTSRSYTRFIISTFQQKGWTMGSRRVSVRLTVWYKLVGHETNSKTMERKRELYELYNELS